jgi:DNA-directed RNA polymerase subunit RPC12/RpoP
MSSIFLQYEIKKAGGHEDDGEEANTSILNGKLIAPMQVCIRCRKEFPLRRGRKSCPHCSGLLITKTMIRRQV